MRLTGILSSHSLYIEKYSTSSLSNLPKVTQPPSGRTRTQPWAAWLCCPPFLATKAPCPPPPNREQKTIQEVAYLRHGLSLSTRLQGLFFDLTLALDSCCSLPKHELTSLDWTPQICDTCTPVLTGRARGSTAELCRQRADNRVSRPVRQAFLLMTSCVIWGK